jgi:hypothetical protein
LAILIGSLLVPVVIPFALPLAIIGALLALAMTSHKLKLSGLIGLRMLIGIVVTHAIVLLDVRAWSACCSTSWGRWRVRLGCTWCCTSLTVVMVLTGPLAGRLTDRMGSRSILMLGFVLVAAGIAGVAVVKSVTSTSLTLLLPLRGWASAVSSRRSRPRRCAGYRRS